MCMQARRASPSTLLASRLGMTNKRAFKLLAEFSKRYGVLETNEQQGRMQMKVQPHLCGQQCCQFGAARISSQQFPLFPLPLLHPLLMGAVQVLQFRLCNLHNLHRIFVLPFVL